MLKRSITLAVAALLAILGTVGIGQSGAAASWGSTPTLHLSNKNNHSCILVQGNNNNTRAIAYDTCGRPSYNDQLWRVEPARDGYWRLRNVNSGKCLVAAHWSDYKAAQYTCGAYADQEWKISTSNAESRIEIRSMPGQCLSAPHWAPGEVVLTTCDVWPDQLWYPKPPTPTRESIQSRPVYLIHGYGLNTSGFDCGSFWYTARTKLPSWGWTGQLRTVGFYAGDTNCTVRLREGNHEVPLRDLAKDLAWKIHDEYSKQGVAVDILAHSMGGLIARAALTGDQQNWADWPPYLFVEDAVTLGTPHGGTYLSGSCWTQQCADMRPGSSFLNLAGQNPQSSMGTRWTLIGSDADEIVSGTSAQDMGSAHKVLYDSGEQVRHMDLLSIRPDALDFGLRYWDDFNPHWVSRSNGMSPIRWAHEALRFEWSY